MEDYKSKLNELPVDIKLRAADRLKIHLMRQKYGYFSRLCLLMALIGPGILVMIADNDAGGVMTYAQTGSIFGISFFIPFMIIMLPVAYIVQEMTVRLGAVTHRGHAEMIWKRYGKFWGAFSLIDLVVANVLTLITEFIGITIGMEVFGISPVVSSVTAIALIASIQLFLRYFTWEWISLSIAVFNLIFVPLVFFIPHLHWGVVARSFVSWHIPGGINSLFIYVVLANLGTTIAPWMLFFQQSSVVDKGLTVKDIRDGQIDTFIGSFFMVIVAIAIILIAAGTVFGFTHAPNLDIQNILSAVSAKMGPLAMKLFALGLVEGGLIAAIAISASTSWAMGEAFGWPKSINMPPLQGWKFYMPGIISLLIAGGIVLIPNAPLGFLNLTVQVVATIFMPAAMMFLLLLLNDKGIMGEHVNKPWQNISAFVIVGFLIIMNGIYGLTVVFPHIFG
ncbi:MAG: NRAMP family divalent metal transporter [bacterium]